MRMIVRRARALDPKGKHGLAQLVASLLTQGAGGKSAGELNETIDFVGGDMGAGAGTDLSFINMVVMKDSLGLGLSMLSDLARRPTFAPEEIERRRQQMLSSLKVSVEDPEFIANSVFDRLTYGLHPYGMPQTGTPESIAAIARDDIVVSQRNFVPKQHDSCGGRHLTAEEAFEASARVGDGSEARCSRQVYPPPDPPRRVKVVNGRTPCTECAPDIWDTTPSSGIHGAQPVQPDSRRRGRQSLTRSSDGSVDLRLKPTWTTAGRAAPIEASTNTRSGATGEVLRLMVDEFWRLQRERVSERELSDAKAYLAGSFPLTIETPDAIATQILNVLFYGLPIEELQSFRQRVNAVTPDDIERVARFYLRPDGFRLS